MGIQMSRKKIFGFEDLEDDAIYDLFKFLGIKEVVKFERLNQRIRELNLSLQRCKTASLAFFMGPEKVMYLPSYDCGVPSHWQIRTEIHSAGDRMLEICKKFPKTSSIHLDGSVGGNKEMGQKIGRACPDIKHMSVTGPHSEALAVGILGETDVTHLSALFLFIDFNYDRLFRLCPNLTYFEINSPFVRKSMIAKFCPKLQVLKVGYISRDILSDLAPQLRSINYVFGDDLHAIADKMQKLETLVYHSSEPFQAPGVQNFPNLAHFEISGGSQPDEVLSYFVTGNHRLQYIKTKLWSNPNTMSLINEHCTRLEILKIDCFEDATNLNVLPFEEKGEIKRLKRLKFTCFDWDTTKKIIEQLSDWEISVDCLIFKNFINPQKSYFVKEAMDLQMKIKKLAIGNGGTKVEILMRSKPMFEIIERSNLPNLKAVLRGDEKKRR